MFVCSVPHVCWLMIRMIRLYRGLCTGLLAFALPVRLRKNPGNHQLGHCLMKGLCDQSSNGVIFLQMRSVGSHSTTGREKEGIKERIGCSDSCVDPIYVSHFIEVACYLGWGTSGSGSDCHLSPLMLSSHLLLFGKVKFLLLFAWTLIYSLNNREDTSLLEGKQKWLAIFKLTTSPCLPNTWTPQPERLYAIKTIQHSYLIGLPTFAIRTGFSSLAAKVNHVVSHVYS